MSATDSKIAFERTLYPWQDGIGHNAATFLFFRFQITYLLEKQKGSVVRGLQNL